MEAILWGWREIGKNYPDFEDIKSFEIFKDLVIDKIKDKNNAIGKKYELIKISFIAEMEKAK